jgi:hypothetical protein
MERGNGERQKLAPNSYDLSQDESTYSSIRKDSLFQLFSDNVCLIIFFLSLSRTLDCSRGSLHAVNASAQTL